MGALHYSDWSFTILRNVTFRGVEEILENLRGMLYVTMYDPAQTIRYEEIINPLEAIKASLIDARIQVWYRTGSFYSPTPTVIEPSLIP